MAQILRVLFCKGIITLLGIRVLLTASADFQIWTTKEQEDEITSKELEIFLPPAIILEILVVAKCLF